MRLSRALLITVSAVTLAALSGCAGGQTATSEQKPKAGASTNADLTLDTVDGPVTLEKTPERVVVFDYAALDTLHALGLDDVVVATPTELLPKHLAGFAKGDTVNAGTLKEPDFEAVAGAGPDLIIVSGRTAGAIPELSKIATTVNLSPEQTDFLAAVTERAVDLAGVFGKQDEAKKKVAEIDALAEEIKGEAKDAGTGLFIMSSGGKLSAYGPGSRFGFLYDDLGIAPAAELTDAGPHGQEISFEFLAEHNPSLLVVLDRDAAIGNEGQAAAQVLDNELVNSTDAARQKGIVYVDGQSWYLVTGGLTTTKAMLDEVRSVFS